MCALLRATVVNVAPVELANVLAGLVLVVTGIVSFAIASSVFHPTEQRTPAHERVEVLDREAQGDYSLLQPSIRSRSNPVLRDIIPGHGLMIGPSNRMAWRGSGGCPSKPENLMADSGVRELIIENRHNGERLAMRRVKRGDEVWLELKGSLPPHRQGPPLHIHVAEDEEGVVKFCMLSAVLNGR